MHIAARAAVATSALALVGLSSAPANAAGNEVYVAYANSVDYNKCSSGGAIGFSSYGEHVTISDTCKDDKSAIGVVHIASTNYYYWNRNGAGTTREVNLDLYEGQPIGIQSCLGDWSGTPTGGIDWVSCGSIKTVTA